MITVSCELFCDFFPLHIFHLIQKEIQKCHKKEIFKWWHWVIVCSWETSFSLKYYTVKSSIQITLNLGLLTLQHRTKNLKPLNSDIIYVQLLFKFEHWYFCMSKKSTHFFPNEISIPRAILFLLSPKPSFKGHQLLRLGNTCEFKTVGILNCILHISHWSLPFSFS